MIQAEFLAWDTDFLGFPTARITLTTTVTKEELLPSIKKMPYHLIYVFDLHHCLSGFVYEDSSFYLTDTKVTYKKSILSHQEVFTPDISVVAYRSKVVSDDLYALAISAGRYSRFAQDKRLGTAVFEKLYRIWIENSINGLFANQVWVAYRRHQAVGLVTVSRQENTSTIGLIAVADAHQRAGIGQALLQTVENWCLTVGISSIRVATQSANISACRFYEKAGFVTESVVPIYHAWNLKAV